MALVYYLLLLVTTTTPEQFMEFPNGRNTEAIDVAQEAMFDAFRRQDEEARRRENLTRSSQGGEDSLVRDRSQLSGRSESREPWNTSLGSQRPTPSARSSVARSHREEDCDTPPHLNGGQPGREERSGAGPGASTQRRLGWAALPPRRRPFGEAVKGSIHHSSSRTSHGAPPRDYPSPSDSSSSSGGARDGRGGGKPPPRPPRRPRSPSASSTATSSTSSSNDSYCSRRKSKSARHRSTRRRRGSTTSGERSPTPFDIQPRYRSASMQPRNWRKHAKRRRPGEHQHRDGESGARVRRRYSKIIRRALKSNVELPRGMKPKDFSMQPLTPYAGEARLDVFEGWLYGLLRRLKINQLTEEDHEAMRVIFTGTHLTGIAEEWYRENVEDDFESSWTFEQLIHELFDQFVHDSSLQEATTSFWTAEYNPKRGTNGWYTKLRRLARRMVEHPGEYNVGNRFLGGLPSEIRDEVLRNGLTAENSRLDELYDEAKIAENALRNGKMYDTRLNIVDKPSRYSYNLTSTIQATAGSTKWGKT
ncbi:hypothetical protein GGG16DRAFT_119617 [Schizophyllum commune]